MLCVVMGVCMYMNMISPPPHTAHIQPQQQQVEPPSVDRDAPLKVSFAILPVVGGAGTPGYMLPPPSSSSNPFWFARPDSMGADSTDPNW